jgi:Tfp pilus assembly protein PilF
VGQRGDAAGASENYNRAVLYNPSDTDALCDFANFLKDKNASAAEELLLQAVMCKPHAVDTLSSYADFLQATKNDPNAAGERAEALPTPTLHPRPDNLGLRPRSQ